MNPLLFKARHHMVGQGLIANYGAPTQNVNTGKVHLTTPAPITMTALNPNANPSNPVVASVPVTPAFKLNNAEKLGLGALVLGAVLYFSGAIKL